MKTTTVKCLDCGIFSEPAARCPVCGRVDNTALDKLTDKVTAFRTWDEFTAVMRTGYVPTIYGSNKAKKELTKAVRAAGFRVFDGKQVA